MAKSSKPAEKEPGRIRQIVDIAKMTAKYDKTAVVLMVLAFALPIIAGLVVCLLVYRTNIIMWVLLMLLAVLVGLVLFMAVLNRRAEKVAYGRLAGQPGATGAVLQSSLRGLWRTSDQPVAINPRTQDLVFRAIGRPGVVLFTESSGAAAKKLLVEEQRKVQRVAPNVPVKHILVGEGGVPLTGLRRELKKLPTKLRKPEILAIESRLQSLRKNELPIPKGVDPTQRRIPRSQIR